MSPSLTSPRFISSLSPVTSCNLARPPQHSARHHRSNAVTFAAQHPSPTPQCLLLSIPSPSLAKNALNLKLNLHPDLFPDMIPLAESDNRINQATQEWNYQECSKKHPLFCNQLVRSSSHTYRVDLLWCTSRMKWKPQTENSIITILLHSIQSASDKKSGNMRKKCRSGEVPPKKKERRDLRTLPPNAKRNLVYSRERLSLHPSLRETQQIGRQMSGLQVTCQVTCSVLQLRKLWNLRISERFGYLCGYLWIRNVAALGIAELRARLERGTNSTSPHLAMSTWSTCSSVKRSRLLSE